MQYKCNFDQDFKTEQGVGLYVDNAPLHLRSITQLVRAIHPRALNRTFMKIFAGFQNRTE